MKGVSDLVAEVLVIAFAITLAGVLTFWATSFSSDNLHSSTTAAGCLGAVDIGFLGYNNGTVTAVISNLGTVNLTGFRASIDYANAETSKKYQNIHMADYNITEPMGPGQSGTFVYQTGIKEKPKKFTATAENCKGFLATLPFS